MVEAGPLEEQFARLDIQFYNTLIPTKLQILTESRIRPTLEDGIDNPLLLGATTPPTQVRGNRLVNLKQSRFFIDDMELMLIHQFMVTSTQLANRLIVLVQNGRMAMTMAISRVMVTLETEEDILAFPFGSLEIGRPDGVVGIARPNEFAIISEDVRSLLSGSVELGLGPLARKRGDKEVTLVGVVGCGDGDVQTWRGQVCSRLELPVCGDEGCQRSHIGDGC